MRRHACQAADGNRQQATGNRQSHLAPQVRVCRVFEVEVQLPELGLVRLRGKKSSGQSSAHLQRLAGSLVACGFTERASATQQCWSDRKGSNQPQIHAATGAQPNPCGNRWATKSMQQPVRACVTPPFWLKISFSTATPHTRGSPSTPSSTAWWKACRPRGCVGAQGAAGSQAGQQ